MRAILILNPKSGDAEHSPDRAAAPLRAAGFTVLPQTGTAEEWIAALRQPADLVVVAGGDGTVAEVALNMPPDAPPLAVLPFGTANNLACAMGGWADAEALAEGWREGSHRSLDLAEATGPWGARPIVEAAGFGAFAHGVRRADRIGLKGVENGRAAFRDSLRSAPVLRLRLRIDGGEAIPVETLLLEACTMPGFGPQLRLAPCIAPGDNRLAVVTLAPACRDAMLDWLEQPDAGPPPCDCRPARDVAFEWPGGAVRLDDEPLAPEPAGPVRIALSGARVRVLSPPHSRRWNA
jgi:diacylglycerol kinase family enzyme